MVLWFRSSEIELLYSKHPIPTIEMCFQEKCPLYGDMFKMRMLKCSV